MLTKLDKLVVKYVVALNSKPAGQSETELAAWMDGIDRRRFELLDMLIRKPRYRGLNSRTAWKSKDNPHRPPLL